MDWQAELGVACRRVWGGRRSGREQGKPILTVEVNWCLRRPLAEAQAQGHQSQEVGAFVKARGRWRLGLGF